MGRVGKTRVVETVSERAGISKTLANQIVSLTLEAITEELSKGNSVTMTGFGTWRTKVRLPRSVRSPQDGSSIHVPARIKVQFKPGTRLRSSVEYAVDPEIFFGDGIGVKTEIHSVLAQFFGEGAEAREVFRDGAGSPEIFEQEARDLIETLRKDLADSEFVDSPVEKPE